MARKPVLEDAADIWKERHEANVRAVIKGYHADVQEHIRKQQGTVTRPVPREMPMRDRMFQEAESIHYPQGRIQVSEDFQRRVEAKFGQPEQPAAETRTAHDHTVREHLQTAQDAQSDKGRMHRVADYLGDKAREYGRKWFDQKANQDRESHAQSQDKEREHER